MAKLVGIDMICFKILCRAQDLQVGFLALK